MTSTVFIDTSFFIALLNSRDKYHKPAIDVRNSLPPSTTFITTDAILFELGNGLAKQPLRHAASQALDQIRIDKRIEVVHIHPDLFSQAIELYRSRPDKEWGLTDCLSFLVMAERRLREALTTDSHFEQAGFKVLIS